MKKKKGSPGKRRLLRPTRILGLVIRHLSGQKTCTKILTTATTAATAAAAATAMTAQRQSNTYQTAVQVILNHERLNGRTKVRPQQTALYPMCHHVHQVELSNGRCRDLLFLWHLRYMTYNA